MKHGATTIPLRELKILDVDDDQVSPCSIMPELITKVPDLTINNFLFHRVNKREKHLQPNLLRLLDFLLLFLFLFLREGQVIRQILDFHLLQD